jgi:putative hemolysin
MILPAILLFLLAVLIQALLEGYETGFVSSNPIRVRYMAEEEKSTRASRLLRFYDRPDTLLAALLIGSNLTVLVCTLVVSTVLRSLLPPNLAGLVEDVISILIIAPILLLFAQIIPKSVFRTHPTELVVALATAINFVYVLLWPVAMPIAWFTRITFRRRGTEEQHITPLTSTLEDVRVLVDEGADYGAIEPEEQEMIHSVIDLQTTTAKAIMVPRIAIQAMPDSATRKELVALFAETGRTRIPIYHDTIDSVIGVVNAYSILVDPQPEHEDISRFVKEVMHVPDSIKVIDLFREMKLAKQHIAVVTDEYGGTDGLITLEDILEEIFGEIQDEYDHEESRINKIGPDAYLVDARLPLEEISEALNLPIEDESVETVGGWVMHLAGRIPAQGEVIQHGRVRMTVLAGGANYISRIRLELLPETVEIQDRRERKLPPKK